MGNQKQYFDGGHAKQNQKKEEKRQARQYTKHYETTKNLATQTPLTTGVKLMCLGSNKMYFTCHFFRARKQHFND
jgi:hypothetical protein